jgi:hypothetical protein
MFVPDILDIIILGELHVVYNDRGAHFSSRSECDMDQLGSVSVHSQFLNQFWIASMLFCIFYEAKVGSRALVCQVVTFAFDASQFEMGMIFGVPISRQSAD